MISNNHMRSEKVENPNLRIDDGEEGEGTSHVDLEEGITFEDSEDEGVF